jgi:hypothetical protein
MLPMSPYTSSGSSSSGSSKLTAILWEQIADLRQSGILQQLPQALRCSMVDLQTHPIVAVGSAWQHGTHTQHPQDAAACQEVGLQLLQAVYNNPTS